MDVYAGYANAPSVDGAHSYVHLNSEGRAVAVIFVGDNITTANVDNFLYIYGRGNSNNDYTQVDAFVAGSADALEDLQATGDITAEGIRLYTIDADGYYELDTPTEYDGSIGNLITGTFTNGVSDWTVSNSNASTFVITNGTDSYELALTSDTLLVNDSSYLDDPTAELGAGPDEGDNIAYVLFSLDSGEPDEAKLVVIKNSTSDSTEEDTNNNGNTTFTGTNFATVDMTTGQVTVNYHGSLNAAALRSLILNADSSLTGVTVNGNNTTDWSLTLTDASGTVTIPHADIEFNEYFQVSYNGVSQGYYTTTDEDFDIEATSATASVLDGVSTDSTATTSAVSGAITVDVSALTADVDYWDAYTVTVSGTTTSLTADNTSFSTGDYVKVGAEVVATATDDNSGSLDTISVDNEDGDSVTADTAGGSFSLTFTMEDSNLTITVINN